MAEGDDSMIIVVLLGALMMMCLSSCCSSIMTAYANECDTSGSLGFLAGDWYWTTFPFGILGCTMDTSAVVSGDGGDGGTGGGTGGGGGGWSGGCDAGDTSQYKYDDRKLRTNGSWTCADGWQDTGCNWGDGDNEKRQCRQSINGSTGASESKCNLGTESNFKYRERRKTSSGRWECPKGWADTRCGLVTNADGKWVDGDDKGKKQCRRRIKGTMKSSQGDTCITVFQDAAYNNVTNRSAGEYTFCLDVGTDRKEVPNLKNMDWHDRITHVTVPKGITLELHDHELFKTGANVTVSGPLTRKPLTELTWNSKGESPNVEVNSLKFYKNDDSPKAPSPSSNPAKAGKKVELYRDIKYSGKYKAYNSANVPDASKEGMNKVITSMGITKGYVFKGCDKKNFKGTCKKWTSNTKWIGTTWNDRIQSYKIYKK